MKNNSIAALAVLFSLSACVNLNGSKPPPTLFTLSAPAVEELPSRSAVSGAPITVVVPTVPAAIQTLRIPVRVSPTEYAYLKDAQWIEAPNSLFQRLLSDTITARTKLVVLDPRQTTYDPGHRLTGQLLDFGLDATNRAAPVVRVRYDAVISLGTGAGVATRRFEVARPAASNKPQSVARALNEAAGEVATQVADWIGAI